MIVGAGSSGCVLADRLTADPANKVLLVEAGGSEKADVISMPLAWFKAMSKPDIGWGYSSEPEPHCDNRQIPVPRGKVIGGCGSINGMMYSRGAPADYDQWAQMGASGWSHSDGLSMSIDTIELVFYLSRYVTHRFGTPPMFQCNISGTI